MEPASGAAEAGVGRALNLSVPRACAWNAARGAVWVPDRAAGAWGAHSRLRWAGAIGCGARRAGAVQPAILAARTARMCGGRPPAAPLPNPPPNRARSRHRWRGPQPGRCCARRRVPSRVSIYQTASGAAEAGRWAVPQPQRGPAMRVVCRQGRGVGPDRAAVAWGAHARLRWAGAVGRVGRGGQELGTPAGIAAPTPACAVGARPPPRGQPSRPTTLAADTAGAAPNLGVVAHAVACRRASRSIKLPAVLLKRVVGRSLSPSVVRPCAWCAARAAAVWAGSRRRNVGCSSTAALGGRHRSRGARRAGLGTPAGIAAPTRVKCGGRPPAAPLPNPPPNRARSRHRWRGPKPGRFLHPCRVPSRVSVYRGCQRRC